MEGGRDSEKELWWEVHTVREIERERDGYRRERNIHYFDARHAVEHPPHRTWAWSAILGEFHIVLLIKHLTNS